MNWDNYLMGFAQHAAIKSKDQSTQVGAVITDEHQRIVSIGFNGPPRGVIDDASIDRDTKLKRTIHAEVNAILFAQRDLKGMTIYCTHHPCSSCAAIIIQAGIKRVVVPNNETPFAKRWAADITQANTMFDQSGVRVDSL